MAIDNGKYQSVRDEETDYPSDGSWMVLVHDCHTPSLIEIRDKQATVGTIWKCTCGDRWKLALHTSQERGRSGQPMPSTEKLQWIRITPKDEEG